MSDHEPTRGIRGLAIGADSMNTTAFPVIKGKINGVAKVSRMVGEFPKDLAIGTRAAFWHEKDLFIGKSFKKGGAPGTFRRKLERKTLYGGRTTVKQNSKTWTSQASGLFRGYVQGPRDKINGTQLRMGVLYRDKKKIHGVMEFLADGGKIGSSKQMIIPIAKNLQAMGIKVFAGGGGFAMRQHGEELNLVAIRHGNKVMYYNRELLDQGKYLSALMFIGLHGIRVKQQFNFERDAAKRVPNVMNRLNKAVDKTIRRMDKKHGK